MKKRLIKNLVLLFSMLITLPAFAGGVYQQPADFIKQVFEDQVPKPSVLWLNKDLKNQISDILSHKYKGLRIRYWKKDKRTAWVLEEVGKEKLITAGIVIKDNRIEQVKVLIFRESRGWEIRHDFFTDQFKKLTLKEDTQLSEHIDNISGATLSVRAVKKLAKIALLLDQTVQLKNPD